eukprot:3486492-Pyramimonas_sp.AAC.1
MPERGAERGRNKHPIADIRSGNLGPLTNSKKGEERSGMRWLDKVLMVNSAVSVSSPSPMRGVFVMGRSFYSSQRLTGE